MAQNGIDVEVTAEDGTTSTITVTVTRAGAPVVDGVDVTFSATVPDELPETLPTEVDDVPTVTFEIGVTTGENAITTGPTYSIMVVRYVGGFVSSEGEVTTKRRSW